jgi:GTP-binding protein EngB required for normal cell division
MLIEMLSESHRPFMIIHTKADKVKDESIKLELEKTATFIKGAGSLSSPFIHAISSYNGYGMLELLSNLVYMLDMPLLRKPM